MLRPKKSLLAVFALTRHVDRVSRLDTLVPCDRCAFPGCQYRRRPYRRAPQPSSPELTAWAGRTPVPSPARDPLDPAAAYTTSARALGRWASERLSLDRRDDGSIEATFRYDGTTCTNMGAPLRFLYRVTLGPQDQGYPIRAQRCVPAPDDDGHPRMCRYLTDGAALMRTIAEDRPLSGRPLNDVIGWERPTAAAGCYCEPDSRRHKWGLVLETIHFALARSGNGSPAPESLT
jgi:hypothetical protein